jgi:hypothetical protein
MPNIVAKTLCWISEAITGDGIDTTSRKALHRNALAIGLARPTRLVPARAQGYEAS